MGNFSINRFHWHNHESLLLYVRNHMNIQSKWHALAFKIHTYFPSLALIISRPILLQVTALEILGFPPLVTPPTNGSYFHVVPGVNSLSSRETQL